MLSAPQLSLALREIRNHPRFAAFLALNLALGLAGFVALDAVEDSVSRELEARSRSFLGADLIVTSTRALAAEEETRLDTLAGPAARVARAVQLFSMAGSPERARLVEIRAVDPAFPLYGEIELDELGPAGARGREELERRRGAWLDPALLSQLGAAPGDEVRIGRTSFRILHTIARDGGRPTSGFSIAPRLYVALAHLPATGLVTTGSRVQHQRLYRLPAGADPAAVAGQMRDANGDPRLRIRSHDEATRDLARAYGAVARYLGLVSVVAIFLAGLGASHLFRSFLSRRLREVAVLLCLGATRARAQRVFLIQLWCVALLGAALACALGALLLPALTRIAADLLPAELAPRLGLRSVVLAAVLSMLGSSAACLPLLVRMRGLRPAELFREHANPELERGPRDLLLLLPALLLFWALAAWRSGDAWVGTVFAGIVAAAIALLALGARAGLSLLARVGDARGLPTRLALRQLARSRGSSVAGFVAIGLCALLLSVGPQLRATLARELDPPGGADLPSLFLFDIQPEQVAPLAALVAERGSELQRLSPLVRARLDAINGDAPTRGADGASASEREREARRLRSRRYNLSFADVPTPSERIVTGRPFAGAWDGGTGLPELSLEIDFAETLDLGLGDVLAFDVQGVPVTGHVVSLREVRWQSFQPNFFVTFQRGVLEEAPKTFLASVPRLGAEEREALQASVVAAFPNVSIVDVTRAVRRMLGLLEQLRWAAASTALLCLLVGLVLVFSIARDQARARRWELNLLKVLGAGFGEIRRSLDVEFGLLALLATVTGLVLAAAASAVLARVVLETAWVPAPAPFLAALLAIPLVCIATARAAARRVLRERPLALLQGGD